MRRAAWLAAGFTLFASAAPCTVSAQENRDASSSSSALQVPGGQDSPAFRASPDQHAPVRPGVSGRASRPRVLEYSPGEVIPPGYEPESRASRGLLLSGTLTFGLTYLASVLGGLGKTIDESSDWSPLFIPVVGPLVTIETAHVDPDVAYVFVVDALAQITGIALFAASFAYRSHWLVRADRMVTIEPLVGLGVLGVRVEL